MQSRMLKATLFLMFLLISSVTLVNFSYAEKKFDVDGDGIADIRTSEEIKSDLKAKLKIKNNKEIKELLANIETHEERLEKLLKESPSQQERSAHAARILGTEKALKNILWEAEKLLDSQDGKNKITPDKQPKSKIKSLESSQLKNEIKKMYQISKIGEKVSSILKKANDAEAKSLKKLSGDAKSIYAKTKSPDAKKLGEKIQAQIKDAESDKKQISATDAQAKKVTKQILAIAKENKITKGELDKTTKDSKTDASKNQKPKQNSDAQIDRSAVTPPDLQIEASRIGDLLTNDKPDSKQNAEKINEFIRDFKKLLEDTRPKAEEKQTEPDTPPESLLDDLDPTIRGPDVNEPKPSKEPKSEKPKADQQNPDAPPESILDDVETDSGPDARAPKEKPSDAKSSIDWAKIAEDDMKIIEEANRKQLEDQLRDKQIQMDLQLRLKELKQKITIEDTKKPIIQKDPKPAEVKPKSTKPEKQIIQQDPIITKPSNTKPTLSVPKQVTQEATGPSGANVAFSTSSQDKEDGSLDPVCSPTSGTMFPIGITSVSCTVTDSNNNSVSGTFTVTVQDTTPPTFVPFQPTEGVRDDSGVQVFFDVTANDLVDGNVPVSCNYQSGYKFPPGVTELKCSASDTRGNQSTKTVQITVTVTEQ